MAKLRSVNTKFWDDNWIVSLNPDEKLLFLYLLTNPLTNISGCYEISLRRIAFDTGLEEQQITSSFEHFTRDNKILYRDGWLLILNFIKNQSLNPKITKGIEETVKHCPIWIKDRLSIDYESLSHLNSNSNLNPSTKGDAVSVETGDKSPSVNRRIWTDGVELLVNGGMKTDAAKSFLGKQAKEYGNELLAECIAAAQAKNPVNPQEYLVAILKGKSNGKRAEVLKTPEQVKNEQEKFRKAQINKNPEVAL